ncbi:MAG: hypothetical protein ACK583_02190 [Cyanobacteriota bacterium]
MVDVRHGDRQSRAILRISPRPTPSGGWAGELAPSVPFSVRG